MAARDEISVASSRLAAAEFAAAVIVAGVFAFLGWTGAGFRGAAAYMPVAVCAIGALSALVWAGKTLRQLIASKDETVLSRSALRRLGTMVLLIVAFIVAVPYLGFFTSALVFMAATPVLLGLRNIWYALAAAVSLSVLLWLIFTVLLNTPMPSDVIFGV